MRERLSGWEMTVGMISMLEYDKPKQTTWHSWMMSDIFTTALSSCVDAARFSCYIFGAHSLSNFPLWRVRKESWLLRNASFLAFTHL